MEMYSYKNEHCGIQGNIWGVDNAKTIQFAFNCIISAIVIK